MWIQICASSDEKNTFAGTDVEMGMCPYCALSIFEQTTYWLICNEDGE